MAWDQRKALKRFQEKFDAIEEHAFESQALFNISVGMELAYTILFDCTPEDFNNEMNALRKKEW